MNKKYITILALLIAISAKSQFYFQFNSGYAKGINNKKYFDKEDSYTNKPYYNLDTSNYSQYNLAQGFFIEPQLGYKITNWLEFSLGFYYNNNYFVNGYGNSFDYEEPSTTITINEYYIDTTMAMISAKQDRYKTKYSSKVYGITPQLSFKKKINKFEFALNIGLFISNTTIFLETDSTNYNTGYGIGISGPIDTTWEFVNLGVTTTNKNNYEMSSKINISARIGLSLSYNINNNFSLYFNTFYNNLEFIPTKRKRTNYFYREDGGYLYGTLSTKQSDEEITEDIEGDLFGMNTLQFSVGIRYIFGKTNKSVTSE